MTTRQADRRLAPLLMLESSTLLSGIGNGIVMLVLPWLVIERTGSATSAAVVATAMALPLLLSSLFSGTVVDLVGRRRTAAGADLLSAAAAAAVPVLDAAIGLTVVTIAILAAAGAVFDPAGYTAREAMLPETATVARVRLDRLNSWHTSVFGSAYLIGPAIGGVLIAAFGASGAIWAGVLGFVCSAAGVALVRVPSAGRPGRTADVRFWPDFWASTVEGLRYVWNHRLIRALAVLGLVLLAAWMPIELVVFPVYFEAQGAPEKLGLVLAALALGVIVGALGYGAIAPRTNRRTVLLLALAGLSLAAALLATLPTSFGLLLLYGGLVGLVYGPIEPIVNVTVQERTPDELRGRVVGVMVATAVAAGPLGYMLAGPMVDAIGVQATLFVTSGVFGLATLFSVASPTLRLLDVSATPVPNANGP